MTATTSERLGRLTRTVDPTAEPVTIDELRQHIRAVDVRDDLYLVNLAKSAREFLERRYRLSFITSTWTWKLDSFCEDILLPPLVPITAVTSITYVDTAGSTQTWSSSLYVVDASGSSYQRSRIYPAYNETWPTVRGFYNDVILTLTAGWTSGNSIPLSLKRALLVQTASMYENRGDASGGGDTIEVSSRESISPLAAALMENWGCEVYI